MQVISLFSGIGGFELAATWMGWDNILSCEINPFGRKVLQHYYPDSYHHDDVKTLTIETLKKTRYDPSADTIICGGFPCQPYSIAGHRKGNEDARHLWPEMLRIITEVQPRWVVGENVHGLINWSKGLVFHEVQAELEAAGYEVWAYVLPACGVNAPHRRDRIWFVAKQNDTNPDRNGQHRGNRQNAKFAGKGGEYAQHDIKQICDDSNPESGRERGVRITDEAAGSQQSSVTPGGVCGIPPIAADTNSGRQPAEKHRQAQSGRTTEAGIPDEWANFPTQSPIRGRNDGLSPELSGITFSKHRNESIKAYGNAIVPQVAHQIFKSIEDYEKMQG